MIDDVCEGGVEIQNMYVLDLAEAFSEVAVVEGRGHVATVVAGGLVCRPRQPRRASHGVQLVH